MPVEVGSVQVASLSESDLTETHGESGTLQKNNMVVYKKFLPCEVKAFYF